MKSDALGQAAALASVLGCPVYQQTIAYGAHFPSEHPCFMGALVRDQRQVRAILSEHDLLLVLGADPLRMSVYSETDPFPPDLPVIQVGLVDWDIAKNFPVALGLKADVGATLEALVPILQDIGGEALAARAAAGTRALAGRNWSARRAALSEELSALSDRVPIEADWLALQLVEALPNNAILIDEGLTSSRRLLALRPHRDRYGYHALASGGIGWGLPASVGASLANLDRPVVCYCGDGSAMYSIQALWTAARHKLPLTVVIPNNGGYRIIKERLKAFHQDENFVGMDFADPAVDFAALARSLGAEATRVDRPDALFDTLSDAFSRPGTKLVEVIVDGSV